MLRKTLAIVIAALWWCGCTTTPATQAPQQKEVPQLDFKTPKGWTEGAKAGLQVFYPPEADNLVAMKAVPAAGVDFKELSKSMWTALEPGVNLPIHDYSESKSEGGHRKIKVIHDPGDSYDGIYVTDAFVIDGIAHLSMVKIKVKLYSKRKPQISDLFEPIFALDKAKMKNLAQQKPADITPRVKELDEYISKAFAEINLQGAALGVIQNGKVIFAKGYGHTRAGGPKVTKDTLFRIASVSKPLVSLMAAKLVSDGKMSWDDKLTTHIPEWQVQDHALLSKVRIKDSFCACTGIPYRGMTELFLRKDTLGRLNEMKDWQPTAAFGEVYQYSNHLYAAGGYAAARAYRPNLPLQQAYDAAMNDLVLKPLGMTASLSHQRTPYSEASAYPHFKYHDNSVRQVPSQHDNYGKSLDTAGGVWSNVTDMLKYVQLELSKGQSHPGYIKPKELLRRRQKGVSEGNGRYYGLGLVTADKQGLTIHRHSGGLPGYTSYVAFSPEHNWGFVAMENIGSNALARWLFQEKLYSLLYGLPLDEQKLLEQAKTAFNSPRKFAGKFLPLPADAQDLADHYENPELGPLRVYVKDGKLWVKADKFTSELREVKSDDAQRTFTFYGHPMLMVRTFHLDTSNGDNRWTIGRGETQHTFVPVAH